MLGRLTRQASHRMPMSIFITCRKVTGKQVSHCGGPEVVVFILTSNTKQRPGRNVAALFHCGQVVPSSFSLIFTVFVCVFCGMASPTWLSETFPTCQVRVSRFQQKCSSFSFSPPLLSSLLPACRDCWLHAVCTNGLSRAPGAAGHTCARAVSRAPDAASHSLARTHARKIQKECQNRCQIRCQKECQIEWQNIGRPDKCRQNAR